MRFKTERKIRTQDYRISPLMSLVRMVHRLVTFKSKKEGTYLIFPNKKFSFVPKNFTKLKPYSQAIVPKKNSLDNLR